MVEIWTHILTLGFPYNSIVYNSLEMEDLKTWRCIPCWTWLSGWWQLKYFLFSPRKLGKWSNLTNIFSKGLKPPTSCCWFTRDKPLEGSDWNLRRASIGIKRKEQARYRLVGIRHPEPKWLVYHLSMPIINEAKTCHATGCTVTVPKHSVCGIFTCIYHKHEPNVGKYAIHCVWSWLVTRCGFYQPQPATKSLPSQGALLTATERLRAVRATASRGLPPLGSAVMLPVMRPAEGSSWHQEGAKPRRSFGIRKVSPRKELVNMGKIQRYSKIYSVEVSRG